MHLLTWVQSYFLLGTKLSFSFHTIFKLPSFWNVCITDSIPGVGGDKDEDAGQTKEELQEQERLRQEAIKEAERERRIKYKKQEEERETIRAGIREKVRHQPAV